MPEQPWEDRRGMFQRGKELHEPGRKLSNSGIIAGTGSAIMDNIRRSSTSSSSGSLVDKPLSNDPGSPSSPTTSRRQSSTAGKFGNLQQHKRGGDTYDARRASQTEQMSSGGLMSGWFNSTFKGIKKPVEENAPGAENKRGVME